MNKFRKLLAIVICVIMALGICGCAKPEEEYSYYTSYITTTNDKDDTDDGNSKDTSSQETNSASDTEGKKENTDNTKLDLKGRTIKFTCGWAEPTKGSSAFANAYWAKKLEVEKKYNCKFEFVYGTGDWYDTMILSILSGTPNTDVFNYTGNPYPAISNELFYDLTKIKNFDLTEKKWNEAVFEVGTVGKKQYTMLSSRFEAPAAILYNKDIFEAQGLPDLYTLQKKGELTFDKFISILKQIKMPSGKYAAMAYNNAFNAHRTFMYSYGGAYITRKEGTLDFTSTINNSAVISGFNAAQDLINSGILHNGRNGSQSVDWQYSRQQFAAGNTAVLIGDYAWTNPFTNGDFEPGIVLIPTVDGGTANIFKEANTWCAIPYNVKNVEEVAAVFNEMTDVIFDVNYKIKYQDIVSDDVMELINKSSEMQVNGDYIPDYSTICVSLWDDGVGNTLNNMVAGKTTVAQAVQTIEPIIKTKIKSMLE